MKYREKVDRFFNEWPKMWKGFFTGLFELIGFLPIGFLLLIYYFRYALFCGGIIIAIASHFWFHWW